jgi:hypothetical protein
MRALSFSELRHNICATCHHPLLSELHKHEIPRYRAKLPITHQKLGLEKTVLYWINRERGTDLGKNNKKRGGEKFQERQ